VVNLLLLRIVNKISHITAICPTAAIVASPILPELAKIVRTDCALKNVVIEMKNDGTLMAVSSCGSIREFTLPEIEEDGDLVKVGVALVFAVLVEVIADDVTAPTPGLR